MSEKIEVTSQETTRTVRAVFLNVDTAPVIGSVGTDLDAMSKAVGGLIQYVPIEVPGVGTLDLWLNEEGKLNSLPPNRLIFGGADLLVGNAFITRNDGEGDLADLSVDEAEAVVAYITKRDAEGRPLD
jgi:hypothetical protein